MKDICLLNDSFPPIIDGVSNTVANYARVIASRGNGVCVVTRETSMPMTAFLPSLRHTKSGVNAMRSVSILEIESIVY